MQLYSTNYATTSKLTDWPSGQEAICCCKHWLKFKTAALNPSDPHWVLAGSLLHSLLPADLAVIAEGSLLNKVFPSEKEYHTQLKTGLHSWTKRNDLPSMPNQHISDLCHKLWTEHSMNVTCRITKFSITAFQMARSFIVKTNRPHLYESTVLVSTTRPLTTPSKIRPSSNQFLKIQRRLSRLLSASFNNNTANHIHRPSVPDDNSQRGTFWPNERRRFKVVDPSFPVLILLSDLCSTSWLE